MRVRPFFWGILVFVCLGVLILAVTVPREVPARLSIQLIQLPTLNTPATVLVKVTDAEGMTVNDAQIVSHAWMTNMSMTTNMFSTTPKGQGAYLVRVNLSMTGPWIIAVSMQANGFAPLDQTLLVHVLSRQIIIRQV